MADKRREPIERTGIPLFVQPLTRPSAAKMSSTDSNASRDSEESRVAAGTYSKRKPGSKVPRPRKRRRRAQILKSYPSSGVEMSRLSSGGSRSSVDDQEIVVEGDAGDGEDPDSPEFWLSKDVPVLEAADAKTNYMSREITAGLDTMSQYDGYDSSSEALADGDIANSLVNAAAEMMLRPMTRPSLRRQPSVHSSKVEETLPRPVTFPKGPRPNDIVRINSNFLRLNFALISILVHISTQDPPSAAQTGTAMARVHAAVNSSTLFFPLLLFILFEPSSSHMSKWARNFGIHLYSFWIRTLSVIFVVIIEILVVVEVFQHLPRWIGILLLVIAVSAFVPFLVIVLVLNLLHECHNAHINETSIRVVINVVYGSLIFVHILEMRPSLLNAIINAATPSGKASVTLNIASLCFNLAIILQLPALFLEASCVGFCNCAVGRGGNTAGVASLLLTVLFQTSLSSFLAAVGVTMVANGVSTLGFCLYVGLAAIFVVLIGCYQLDILPVKYTTSKERIE